EARRPEDLNAEVYRGLLWERGLARHDLLERPPGQVLHRDVVGALVLPAVEDAYHVGVLEPGGGARLAPEALDELLVLREAPVEHLERHVAAQVHVLRAIDVRHAPGADPAEDPVAAVDQSGVGELGHFSLRSTWSTCLAIGAATVPPCPEVRSTVAA